MKSAVIIFPGSNCDRDAVKALENAGRVAVTMTDATFLIWKRVESAPIPIFANTSPNEQEMDVWRDGMKAMAACPNVYIKLSMLGYSLPGWMRNETRIGIMRDLVQETVSIFGPERCMVATNWWKNAAMSDADGLSDVGPDAVQFITFMADFLSIYTEEERQRMFCGTARDFYRI